MYKSTSGNFTSILSNTLKGSLPSLRSVVAGSENSALLTNIKKNITELRSSVERANLWVQIFNIVGDTISANDDVIIDNDTLDIADVTDRSDLITEGISFIKEQYGSSTFTDEYGYLYGFCVYGGIFRENGIFYESLLSTCENPQSVKDCIFYRRLNDNHLLLNAVLRSRDWVNKHVNPYDNLLDNEKVYCRRMDIDMNGTLLNGYNGTIMDYYTTLSTSGSTLLDKAQNFARFSLVKGKVRWLWDVVKEYLESSEINTFLLEACEALSLGYETLKTWLTATAAKVQDRVQVVKDMYSNLMNAYYTGGFKGVVMYIYNFFKTASSATDENGLLIFTDNNSLVPAQYVVGMVGKLVSTAFAAAGVLVSAFSKIAGSLIAMAGSVAYGIFKSINYDSSATKAGIQTSELVAVNCAPYAIFQGSTSINEDDELYALIQDVPIFYLDVIGGILICGPGGYDEKGNVNIMRFEFHPSLEDFRPLAVAIADASCLIVSRKHDQGEYTFNYGYKAEGSSITWLSHNVITNMFSDYIADDSHIRDYVFENSSNGRLSDHDDRIMKEIIMSNMFLFAYWMMSLTHPAGSVSYPLGLTSGLGVGDFAFSSNNGQGIAALRTDDDIAWIMSLAPVTNTAYPLYNWVPTWKNIADYLVIPGSTGFTIANQPYWIIKNMQFFGRPCALPTSFDYALVPAKYDSATFLAWIIVASVVTVAVTVAAVAVTLKVKKTIQGKRAQQNARVEADWDRYKKGEISYDDYRKTVKTANRWQRLIGGTRYDFENYWNGDVSGQSVSAESSENSTVSGLKSMLNNNDNSNGLQTISIDGVDVTMSDALARIYKSIVG